jgi:Raf kinase inhibitor-like YbhB/YbcL family protein
MLLRASLVAATWVMAAVFAAGSARAADPFMLSSSGFKDGELLATKMAGNLKTNANCVGENVSPALAWANPPEGTKSFALVMFDPEGRPPGGVTHLVIYGIPPSVTGFAEGELAKASDKFVGGSSVFKLPTYMGPCTPPGPTHHYIFLMIATDLEPAALKAGLTREELMKELDGHSKSAAAVIGTFHHP